MERLTKLEIKHQFYLLVEAKYCINIIIIYIVWKFGNVYISLGLVHLLQDGIKANLTFEEPSGSRAPIVILNI